VDIVDWFDELDCAADVVVSADELDCAADGVSFDELDCAAALVSEVVSGTTTAAADDVSVVVVGVATDGACATVAAWAAVALLRSCSPRVAQPPMLAPTAARVSPIFMPVVLTTDRFC
jgi:hypothetical protein